MEKVLVVEDDKLFSKVIESKLKQINIKPFVAPTMKDAQILITEHSFFAALLDLNLPDAPDGEIVDFVLEKKIPSIVLTGTYNNDMRIAMTKKPIVDYVVKMREESIDYAVHLIKRIRHYRETKALIVEDSAPQRLFMRKLLNALLFQTFEAENGVQALEVIKQHPDIKLVLTDFHMPEMDGFELTLQLRKQYKEDSLVIIALTAHDSKDTSSKFLKFGASDYLAKPFTKEEFNYRINKKMDILEMIHEIKDYSEKLEIANDSIRHANTAKLKYIQTIEEYLDIIDRNVLISKTNLEGEITYASNAFLRSTGYEWTELVGQNHRIMRHPDMPDEIFKEMWSTITQQNTWTGELKNRKKSGDVAWFQTTISPIIDDNKEHIGYVSIRNDMTDRFLAQKLVMTDPLTKVYNRKKIDSALELEIERTRRHDDPLILILLEVDNYEKICDSKGISTGERVLVETARFVHKRCRVMDTFARWSSNIFAVLGPKTELEGAKVLSSRIMEDLNGASLVEGVSISYSMSAVVFRKADSKEEFIKQAESLLKKAKEKSNGQIEYGS